MTPVNFLLLLSSFHGFSFVFLFPSSASNTHCPLFCVFHFHAAQETGPDQLTTQVEALSLEQFDACLPQTTVPPVDGGPAPH